MREPTTGDMISVKWLGVVVSCRIVRIGAEIGAIYAARWNPIAGDWTGPKRVFYDDASMSYTTTRPRRREVTL